MDRRHERALLQVLQGLTYPAEKWQIVTQAEIYGADGETRGKLYRLPMREYATPAEITAALDGNESSAIAS
jgi:hypothetical protein